MNKLLRARTLLLITLLTISYTSFGQSKIEMQVEGRKYKNAETGLVIVYGYISTLNTYGITITNKNGVKFHFMNCDKRVASDEMSMILRSCFNPNDGSGVGTIYVYPKKIVTQATDIRMEYELVE
jgi:hypothetical protein